MHTDININVVLDKDIDINIVIDKCICGPKIIYTQKHRNFWLLHVRVWLQLEGAEHSKLFRKRKSRDPENSG